MSYHTPEDKTEQAFHALFTQLSGYELNGLTWFRSYSGETLVEPCGIIQCAEAEPPPGDHVPGKLTGNWLVSVRIAIRSHCDRAAMAATKAQHMEWVGAVSDLLINDDIVSDLNTVMADQEFRALEWMPGRRRLSVVSKSFVTEIEGRLHMMPSRG